MLQRNLSWEWKQILKFFHSQCRQKPLVATAIAAKDRLQRKKEYSAGCLKKKKVCKHPKNNRSFCHYIVYFNNTVWE